MPDPWRFEQRFNVAGSYFLGLNICWNNSAEKTNRGRHDSKTDYEFVSRFLAFSKSNLVNFWPLSSCSWPRTQFFFCRGNTLLVKARLRVWPLYWWKGGRGWASKKWPNTRHEIWYMYWFIHVHIELDPRARSFMKFTAAAQLRSLSSRIVSLSEKNRIEIQNIS